MSRLFLDTNILLDLVSKDRTRHEAAIGLAREVLTSGKHSFSVLASSLKDVYYVFERHYGSEQAARDTVRDIRMSMEVVDLTLALVDRALEDDEPDFEDGLIREAVLASGSDMLVTRDANGFMNMPVPVATAEEALARLSRH